MIFKYHPDRIGKDDADAEELIALRNQQTMVINAAYRILKDPTLRTEYDFKHREPIRTVSSNVGGFGGPKVTLTSEELEQRTQDKAIQDELKKNKRDKEKKKIALEKEKAELRKAEEKKKIAEAKKIQAEAIRKGKKAKDTSGFDLSPQERFPQVPAELLETFKEYVK